MCFVRIGTTYGPIFQEINKDYKDIITTDIIKIVNNIKPHSNIYGWLEVNKDNEEIIT